MTFTKPLILSLMGVAVLAGCADPYANSGGYTQPTDNTRRNTGAATGAIIGGLIGASASDDKLEKAVVGAGIGGILGAAVGTTLDRQAADLRNSVSGNVGVTNTGSQLVVTMPQDILFATNSATLRPDLTRDLQAVSQNLLNYPNSTIQIVGHTDNTGEASYNQSLSERRAYAVAQVLRNNGVPASRVGAYGRGEDQPIASNLTEEGKARNRRVDIIIQPTN